LKFDNEKIKEVVQIQEKLHVTYGRNRKKAAIGIYPFEKITMPIYYKALDPKEIKFRPLESEKEMTGLDILSKHPAGKEYGYLLEGLDKFPVFVDAENRILSMPPIINSHETGKINEDTKDVFIECSGFDFEVLNILLNIIVTALADMGGEIYSMELYYKDKRFVTPDLRPKEMKVDLKYLNRLLGLDLDDEELKKLFDKMGYSYANRKVLIPSYRADILHPIDLVEDIAIAYGYENFKYEIPNVSTTGEEDEIEVFKRKIREVLIGLGLLESSSFIITSRELVKGSFVEIDNPINKEYDVLRNSLIPSLLQVLSRNKHNEYPQKIFEVGLVNLDGKDTNLLSIASSHEKANFTEMKQVLDALFLALDLNYKVEEVKDDSFIEGRVGKIIIDNKEIGIIGEINPRELVRFDLDMPVSGLEIDLERLFKLV